MNKEKQKSILRLFKSGHHWCDASGIVYSGPNILGQRLNRSGYRLVTLAKVPIRLDAATHQVCYLFFNGAFDETLQINHIDGNKLSNAIENLEAITASENQLHAVKLGLFRDQTGDKNCMSKLSWKTVRRIRALHAMGVTQRSLAIKYDVTHGNINNIVLNKTWKE